jgi:hypothetical protein
LWRDCGVEYLSTAGCAKVHVSFDMLIVRIVTKQNTSPALAVVIATQVVSILHVLKNFYVYSRANQKADRGEIVLEGQEGFRQTL